MFVLEGQNELFWTPFWPNLVPKDQNHTKKARKPNKAIFILNLKPCVTIFLKKFDLCT